MGAPLEYSNDEPANCADHIIKSEEDLEKIHVADAQDGKFPVYYKALDSGDLS